MCRLRYFCVLGFWACLGIPGYLDAEVFGISGSVGAAMRTNVCRWAEEGISEDYRVLGGGEGLVEACECFGQEFVGDRRRGRIVGALEWAIWKRGAWGEEGLLCTADYRLSGNRVEVGRGFRLLSGTEAGEQAYEGRKRGGNIRGAGISYEIPAPGWCLLT